jgi:hypothetical protein
VSIEEQLRNDAQSLREVGWFNRAIMMDAAANEIKKLNDRIKRLEKDSERLHWLLKRGLAWRGCYNGHWLEGEWLYSSQYAIATIDTAKEAKL